MTGGRAFAKGILGENPVSWVGLGLCPALAVTSTLKNGLGIVVATCLVLVASNLVASIVAGRVPQKARPIALVATIGALATLVEVAMARRLPGLRSDLGIYVPLVAANCIILARAEVSARRAPGAALVDGFALGLGFALVLGSVAVARELLGTGTIWGRAVFGSAAPIPALAFAPGAFITLGLVAGLVNLASRRN